MGNPNSHRLTEIIVKWLGNKNVDVDRAIAARNTIFIRPGNIRLLVSSDSVAVTFKNMWSCNVWETFNVVDPDFFQKLAVALKLDDIL